MKWLLLIPAILVSSCSSPSNNKIENKQEEKILGEKQEGIYQSLKNAKKKYD